MLAKPQKFLSLINDPKLVDTFEISGEPFKRPRYHDAPDELLPYLNRKNLSFFHSSPNLKKTLSPEIADEIIEAFHLLKPVYRLLTGLE
jgi:hypothetical protein